jgi:hypothetical protein
MWTFNFAYVGTRTTGRVGGTYVIAGPAWDGKLPDTITPDGVFQSESDFVFNLGRTQVYNQEDVTNVISIQEQYQLIPLSLWPGGSFTPDANSAGFTPAYDYNTADPKAFIDFVNYLRGFINTTDYDQEEWAEFASIGIGVENFDFTTIHLPDVQTGILNAMNDIANYKNQLGENQNDWIMMYNVFGDRATMESQANWPLCRASAAQAGLFGNSMVEAFYPSTQFIATEYLDTSKYNYTLEFTPMNPIPKVSGFWSVTLYNYNGLFFPNNANSDGSGKYSVGSNYFTDSSASATIYIQHDKPDDALLDAWLPGPPQDIQGPYPIPDQQNCTFTLTMRLYIPDPSALDDTQWVPPALKKYPRQ